MHRALRQERYIRGRARDPQGPRQIGSTESHAALPYLPEAPASRLLASDNVCPMDSAGGLVRQGSLPASRPPRHPKWWSFARRSAARRRVRPGMVQADRVDSKGRKVFQCTPRTQGVCASGPCGSRARRGRHRRHPSRPGRVFTSECTLGTCLYATRRHTDRLEQKSPGIPEIRPARHHRPDPGVTPAIPAIWARSLSVAGSPQLPLDSEGVSASHDRASRARGGRVFLGYGGSVSAKKHSANRQCGLKPA